MGRPSFGALLFCLVALPGVAQQTGSVGGKVTSSGGLGLAGVRIQARSSLLPMARVVVSGPNGEYRMSYLPPGEYTLLFSHPECNNEKVLVEVLMAQATTLDLAMGKQPASGAVVEVVGEGSLLDPSGELKTALSSDVLSALPLGRDYRSLVSLIPGAPYTQDTVRGPSVGGSGQDNVHLFDGVNVNLPMFGTVSSEASSHDVDHFAVSKGGAAALDFNRSAGYTLNTLSKSGTNTFTGELGYQTLPSSLVARQKSFSSARYDDNQTFTHGNLGGPILKEKLFFFFSYFRPTDNRDNGSNAYGPVPAFQSVRNEYFGKLTFAPWADLLLHASYRNSERSFHHEGLGGVTYAPSTSDGGKVTMDIGTFEAAWRLSANGFLNFKASQFSNRNADRPDLMATAQPVLDGSVGLDLQNLASQGQFAVPLPVAGTVKGAAAYNAAIAPYIASYGYLLGGQPAGGGFVGGYPLTDNHDFYRRTYQLGYDATWAGTVTHDFHFGYQWSRDSEDLSRHSNGWGVIAMPVNVITPRSQKAVTFVAVLQQQGLGVPVIHSESVSQNIEFNDKLQWRTLTFNLGAMVSQDQLYGQGLKDDSSTVSGYALAPGQKYLEHEIRFQETLQPRLGVTWNYRDQDSLFANFARYVPATTTLPRASSWARNLVATVNVYFDAKGNYLEQSPVTGSTGKLYVPGLKPRHTDEYLIGTTRQLEHGLTGRLFARYRYSCNFWEDTRNDSRSLFNPPAGTPQTLYIPNLTAQLSQLGVPLDPKFPNNQFVIAQLDNAFTKYYQAALELEWRSTQAFASLSYSWSHYYGNFDQDNTSTALANDSNIFIGSSNLADDAGRQLWDNKYGNLSGDRRHLLKLFGTYLLPWQAKLGLFACYQSGQPWQYSSYTPYLAEITASGSTSRSDSNRYMEPAGSRRTDPHYQMDVSYTQTFWQARGMTLRGQLEVFNLFNRQTGYDIQASMHLANPGVAQAAFAPRRTQVGVTFLF